jgi:hypothetical protein
LLLLLLLTVMCWVGGIAGQTVRDVGSVRHPEVYLAAARPRHTPGLGSLKAHALYAPQSSHPPLQPSTLPPLWTTSTKRGLGGTLQPTGGLRRRAALQLGATPAE